MKRLLLTAVLMIVMLAIGIGLGRWWSAQSKMASEVSTTTERKVLYWKAPMDPNYRSDAPGKSPMGMDLVPVYADEMEGDDPGVVSISPAVINNLGVRTATVTKDVLSQRIETVGYIDYDEDTLHQINTRVDGWIEKLSVNATGDEVKKGQVLFELYSPTLVNAQEEYLAALKSRNTLLHQASRKRLSALGVTAGEVKRLDTQRSVKQRIRIYARSDGVVAHLGVREGMYIMPATNVMSIAKLDQVWLLAEVFERQASWVTLDQRAQIELDYLPGSPREGVVDYVYPELDPKTRTLKVRLRLSNEDNALRPNMFARVTIFGNDSMPVINIPRQALIRGGRANRVVLALGDGKFRAQEVTLGVESGDRIEIRSGIHVGERIVTSGQFLIDSESNVGSALSRMDDETMNSSSMKPSSVEPSTTEPSSTESSSMNTSQVVDHSGHDTSLDSQALEHGDEDKEGDK